jgi:hypothetical protein
VLRHASNLMPTLALTGGARAVQLVYHMAPIPCQLVTLEQARMDTDATSAKRSRRGRVEATASHSDTLADLKVRLYEGLKVHPLNMRAFVHGEELTDDFATLAESKVGACDVVNVVREGDAEDFNVESVIEYKEAHCSAGARGVALPRPARTAGKERGFAHTALVGSAPVFAGTG